MSHRRKVINGMLFCNRCKKWLPESEFYAAKNTTSGLSADCKKCFIQRTKTGHMKRRYGIYPFEVMQTLAKQGNCCIICRTPLTLETGSIDHDHLTNKFRGVLCRACNGGLGMFKDDPDLIYKAYLYLTERRSS